MRDKKLKLGITLGLALCSAYLLFVFFSSQMIEAANKPFWGDENANFKISLRPKSYVDMILYGAYKQASAAPLDYLVLKAFDDIKNTFPSIPLKDEVYYRLWANLANCLSLVAVFILFYRRMVKENVVPLTMGIQCVLLLLSGFAFLYSRQVYYYAAEMRPYALWNALWFFVLAASLFHKQNDRPLRIGLILLAFCVSAAIFQILCFALAIIIYQLIEREDMKAIIAKIVRWVLIPFIIVFYYCLHAGTWEMVSAGGSVGSFFDMWNHQSIIIPKMLVLIGLCLGRKEARQYLLAPLTILILYLIGPGIFWITRLKGYFYDARQYIYYDLTNAVFILTVIQCLSVYMDSIKSKTNKVIISILLIALCFSFSFRKKFTSKFYRALENTELLMNNPHIIKNPPINESS